MEGIGATVDAVLTLQYEEALVGAGVDVPWDVVPGGCVASDEAEQSPRVGGAGEKGSARPREGMPRIGPDHEPPARGSKITLSRHA